MSHFVFSANFEPEPVTIEFAYGARSSPAHILRTIDVLQLRSVENLAVLKTINCTDFLSAIENEISRLR